MPRKSRASLEIVPIEQHLPRIETPPGLSQEERELFERLVKQCGPTHFTNSDSPLLVAYVQNIILVDMCYQAALASPDRLPAWERAIKTLAMLARSLRLTPRSRVDPKTLTRSLIGLSQRETGGVSLEALSAIRDGATRGWKARS